MWRVKKLVDAGHLGKDLNVSYVAALSQCWMAWDRYLKGRLVSRCRSSTTIQKVIFS